MAAIQKVLTFKVFLGIIVIIVFQIFLNIYLLTGYTEYNRYDIFEKAELRKMRGILDLDLTSETDKDERISEDVSRIRTSVRKELQILEDERRKVVQEVTSKKEEVIKLTEDLKSLRRDISSAKAELNSLHDALSKKLQVDLSAKGERRDIIVLNEELDRTSPTKPVGADDSLVEYCEMESCFHYSSCTVRSSLTVYLPQLSSATAKSSQVSQLLTEMSQYLDRKDILAPSASEACVNIVYLTSGATQGQIDSFISDGTNTILVDLCTTEEKMADSRSVHVELNFKRLIYASHSFESSFRKGYDITIFPELLHLNMNDYWRQLKPLLPVERKHFLHFHGNPSLRKVTVSVSMLTRLKEALKNVDIVVKCDVGESVKDVQGWQLCGTAADREKGYQEAIFSLVPAEGNPTLVYTRLLEALRWGAVPVILGQGFPLPFNEIIDWRQVTVVMAAQQFNDIHYILSSFQEESIVEMKRRGRFLLETYGRSPQALTEGVLSVMNKRLSTLPPLTKPYKGAVVLKKQTQTNLPTTERFGTQNFTHFCDIYNLPPGPVFSYPVDPFTPPLVSGHQYASMTTEQLRYQPQHVIRDSGVTGPEFTKLLLGNRPYERYTIVILTYQRTDVLLSTIEGIKYASFLDKIIVVWNNAMDPPKDTEWPAMPIPLVVVRGKGNSLNNRFLPFEEIETECVLSMDDDMILGEEQLSFGFRVWRENPDRLVGYPGRFHAWDVRHPGWLYNSNVTCELSMVLTGAAFFHKYYMYLYTYWMYQDIRTYVNEYMNCEDIAMNFLIAHITRKPPIKITTRWTFHCQGCSEKLSDGEEHFKERHLCINVFTEVYGYTPLLYTQTRADSVLFKTKLPRDVNKCYEYV